MAVPDQDGRARVLSHQCPSRKVMKRSGEKRQIGRRRRRACDDARKRKREDRVVATAVTPVTPVYVPRTLSTEYVTEVLLGSPCIPFRIRLDLIQTGKLTGNRLVAPDPHPVLEKQQKDKGNFLVSTGCTWLFLLFLLLACLN